MEHITPDTWIEEMIQIKPETVQYLQTKGIQCIACGEPVWGTIREIAHEKNLNDREISILIDELNNL